MPKAMNKLCEVGTGKEGGHKAKYKCKSKAKIYCRSAHMNLCNAHAKNGTWCCLNCGTHIELKNNE